MNDANSIRDRFEGALLGLAVGDAFCAPYEGGPLERLAWALIGRTKDHKRRWTDDTQMALDLVTSLLACGRLDQDDVARRFAASYRWSRGYGPAAAKMLKRIRRGMPWQTANRSVYSAGSYGNGAAMRSPVIGLLLYRDTRSIDAVASQAAEVTHAHPLAIDGAKLIAHATALAVSCSSVTDIWTALASLDLAEPYPPKLQLARQWAENAAQPSAEQVRRQLGNGVPAADSVVTSVYLGLTHVDRSLMDLLNFTRQLGGDTDTIAAMAGAIWGAMRGAGDLPRELLAELEAESDIRGQAKAFFELSTK